MSRTLAIVALSGLVLCAAFLGTAAVIGGYDVFHDARSMKGMKPLIDLATHKAWRWEGGDTLVVDAPLSLSYSAKGAPQVAVTGPADVLKHVRVGSGRIGADMTVSRASGARLEAVVSGVPIHKFVVNNGESLSLGHIDQDRLDIHINGRGSVTGEGRADELNLTLAGDGRADLGGVAVKNAKVSILGSGQATLSPRDALRLFVAGDGQIVLLTRPKEIRKTILGSGDITYGAPGAHPAQEQTKEPPAIPTPVPMPDVIDKDAANLLVHSNDVDLGHVERDKLNITIAASGSATAEGKVDRLTVSVLGTGKANLGKLAARSVTVAIMGSGEATIAPRDEAKITIMGSGDVHLLTRPGRIQRTVVGSGRIIEPD